MPSLRSKNFLLWATVTQQLLSRPAFFSKAEVADDKPPPYVHLAYNVDPDLEHDENELSDVHHNQPGSLLISIIFTVKFTRASGTCFYLGKKSFPVYCMIS